jgi:hypothetical protein
VLRHVIRLLPGSILVFLALFAATALRVPLLPAVVQEKRVSWILFAVFPYVDLSMVVFIMPPLRGSSVVVFTRGLLVFES